MIREIPFEEGKVVFFKESDFWNEILEKCKNETTSIGIATYNFNFRDKYERTFYKELSKLANLGVDIRLLYAKMTFSNDDKLEVEDIFKNFVLCAQLPTNHSKIFITDNFAYIGSANFSFGSNKNYESGVIFNNKKIISEIKRFFGGELLEVSEFKNIPECFDPFDLLPNVISTVEKLNKIKRKQELYISETRELIPQLRYLDDIEKYLEGLGYKVPVHFDWFNFYMHIYDENEVSDSNFETFKSYIHQLSSYLLVVSLFLRKQYESIGRIELLKKIRVIK